MRRKELDLSDNVRSVMRVVGDSSDELVRRVGEALSNDPEADVAVTVPAGLEEDEMIALCGTLAALGVSEIEGADAKVVRRCTDVARAVRAGNADVVSQ